MDDHKRLLNDDGEDLDREVESCLTGAGPATRFYLGQEAASSPTASFHSTATEYHSDDRTSEDQDSRVNQPSQSCSVPGEGPYFTRAFSLLN